MRPGDHVRLTRDQQALFGGYRKGTVGMVRSTSGLLTPRVTIELTSGVRITVDRRDLRRVAGFGDADFERRREWQKAKTFAGALVLAPALVGALLYLARGGSLGLLGVPVIEAVAGTLLAWMLGPYGLLVLAVLVVLILRRRGG
jgi:hypothetical protein